jgi:choline dehydrogenase-like flavoprotein
LPKWHNCETAQSKLVIGGGPVAGSVVDPQLLLRGMKGLRVADTPVI